MAERTESQARKKSKWWLLWVGAGLTVALILGAAAFLRSSFFQEVLRRRVVAAIESRIGGRVELRQFSFDVGKLQADMRGVVIHGRDHSGEPPLFSADLIQAAWKILSIWELRADLRSLRIWNPQIYIAFDESGRSNIPLPVREAARERNIVAEMLAFRVTRLEAIRGQMRWNEKRVPLNFRAENFQLGLDYEPKRDRYSGKLDFRNVELHSPAVTPPAGALAPQLRSDGRIRFALYSQKAEIESFEWQTPASHLSGQGTLMDFHSPRLQFRYDLLLDWKEAAEALGSRGWQGQMAWQGQGSYGEGGLQLEGPSKFRADRTGIASFPDIPWSARGALRLVGAPIGQPPESFRPWRAEMKQMEMTALNGRLAGDAVIETTSLTSDTRFHLQAEHISMAALSQVLSKAPFSLPRLPWEGFMSGPLEGSFAGAGRNLAVRADWRVTPPGNIPSGFIPVSGVLRGTYQAGKGRLESQGSYLNLPQTYLAADGWLDATDSRLSVNIDTSRVEDTASLTGLFWNRPSSLPLQLHGRAKASFVWSGGTRSPVASGKAELADFEYRETHWDAISGNVTYRQNSSESAATKLLPIAAPRLRASTALGKISAQAAPLLSSVSEVKINSGVLSRGSAVMQFNADVELENGAFTSHSPFAVEASLRNASVNDLQKLAGTQFPIRGTLQGSVKATGTREDPHGQGSLVLTAGEVYGEPFEKATAQVVMESGGRFSLQQIRLQKGQGNLQGEATVGMETKEMRFSLTGSNLALEKFQMLPTAKLPVTGVAQVRLTGTGTLSRPAIQGRIDVSKLAVPGQKDGNLSVIIDAKDGKGQLQLAGNAFRSEFRGTGEVSLQDPFPVSASLEFGSMDLVSILRALRETPGEMRAQADGKLIIEGDLKGAKLRRLQGAFDQLTLSLAAVDLHNAQPVLFRLENDVVKLEQLHLFGKNTDLETAGSIRLTHDPAMDLKVRGYVDLAALDIADQNLAASGRIGVNVTLNGSVGRPFWRGSLDFSDASLRYGNFPNSLSKVKGTLVFEGNRGTLENVTAETGGGQVKLGGFVTYAADTGLGMQLAADISGVRVRYPEGVSTWTDGRLSLTGSAKASTLSGRLVISKEIASPEFDVGAALVRQQQPIVSGKAASLRNMRLDVQVVSAPNITLETTTAKNLKGDVDLRVQGTLEHPSLLGRISILQGEITIGGRRYFADSGDLTFSNPFLVEAILNLHVRARVEQYDINLDFNGPLDRLTVTYSSNPPLRTGEILALLVAGSAYGTTRTPTSNATQPEVGASSLLSQALNQQMGSRLDRIFGAGHIRVESRVAGFGSSANANVALEQHIKDNLTLLYVTNVTSAQQQLIQAELALSPRFSVAATRDENGLVGVNFQIKLRFR